MAKTPEAKVKDKIKALLKKYGCWFAQPIMQGMAQNGTPDLLACVGGMFMGVEVKAGKGKPTELQKVQLRKIAESGGVSVVVNEQNLDQFEALLLHVLDHVADSRAAEVARGGVHSTLADDWGFREGPAHG